MAWANVGMEQLIPIVNRLQDAFSNLGVPLAFDLVSIHITAVWRSSNTSIPSLSLKLLWLEGKVPVGILISLKKLPWFIGFFIS